MDVTIIDRVLADTLAAQYPSMQSLDLRGNGIREIRDLSPLSRLRELRLDNNCLSELGGLHGFTLLTVLIARDNAITRLGDGITSLINLRVLDVAGNQLAAGPWVGLLTQLPKLTELDVRGNPICIVEGSHQLLSAAVPCLRRLNGTPVGPPGPPPDKAEAEAHGGWQLHSPEGNDAGKQWTAVAGHPGDDSLDRGALPADIAYSSSYAADSGQTQPDQGFLTQMGADAVAAWRPPAGAETARYARLSPSRLHLQQHQHDAALQAMRTGVLSGELPSHGAAELQAEVQVLRVRLQAAHQAHDKLLQQVGALLAERELLGQRAAAAEEALQRTQNERGSLQQQLNHHLAEATQQVTSLTDQMASLAAERTAAARHADALAAQLSHERTAAAEAAQAANGLQQQVDTLRGDNRRLQLELSATEDLLLQAQAAAQTAPAPGPHLEAQRASDGQQWSATAPGRPASPGAVVRAGQGGAAVEVALQQRVVALQHVVRVQEQELARLARLKGLQPAASGTDSGAGAGASAAHDGEGVEGLLQPWREQLQLAHEQLKRQAAEGAEQRAQWSQQLEEMREQFGHARSLMEVLERRAREQRSENAQLHAQLSRLGAELQDARQRSAHLNQQLAVRDASAQAVRRQLVAFKAQHEQHATALESYASQLGAHAARLSYASTRLGFVLRLAAVRRQGGPFGQAPPAVSGPLWTPWKPAAGGTGWQSHVVLQGALASSPAAAAAAAVAASTGVPGRPPGGVPPRREASSASGALRSDGGNNSGGHLIASGLDEGPLAAVLRQELARVVRDREVLLQQLAQVSTAAEERIRAAHAAMQEREVRQWEALVAARLEATQRTAEAAAEARVQSAEAASAFLAAQVRQQLQGAVQAAEDACRRAEAHTGVRVSRTLVRLQDLAKQVELVRARQRQTAKQLESLTSERDRLRRDLAEAQAAEAELRREMASQGREAHAQVAELQAAHEEALSAERRRTAETERLAAKAASECGQLERQLARVREAKVQQGDARLWRLESQLHDQDTQLRSLRRERATLLAVLRKHNLHAAPDGEPAPRPINPPAGSTGTPPGAPTSYSTAAAGASAMNALPKGRNAHGGSAAAERSASADQYGGEVAAQALAADTVLPLPPRLAGRQMYSGLAARAAPADGSGGDTSKSISSILRGPPRPTDGLGLGQGLPDTFAPRDAWGQGGAPGALPHLGGVEKEGGQERGTAPEVGSLEVDLFSTAGVQQGSVAAPAGGDSSAVTRLAELEALTAELLFM